MMKYSSVFHHIRAFNNIESKQLMINSRQLCPMEGHSLCALFNVISRKGIRQLRQKQPAINY